MNVIHFICADGFSGLERMACNIIRALPGEYHGYYAAPDGEGIKTAASLGIDTVVCNTSSVSEIKRVVRKYSPCICHAHDPRMALCCSLAGVPFLAQLHSNCPWLGEICANSLGLRYAVSRASSVICVSESVVDEFVFKKQLSRKAVILNNFIEKDEILALGAENIGIEYDLCFVGRLTELKRPELFVRLVSDIKKQIPAVKAVFVGDGEKREEIRADIENRGLSDNIDMAGFQHNPYKYMSASRLGVMTSSHEGFGLCAAESMLFAKPVLCYPVGGLPDVVDDSCGLLCENPPEMAGEAVKLLSDAEYYARKSRGALVSAQRFCNADEYIGKLSSEYRKLSPLDFKRR